MACLLAALSAAGRSGVRRSRAPGGSRGPCAHDAARTPDAPRGRAWATARRQPCATLRRPSCAGDPTLAWERDLFAAVAEPKPGAARRARRASSSSSSSGARDAGRGSRACARASRRAPASLLARSRARRAWVRRPTRTRDGLARPRLSSGPRRPVARDRRDGVLRRGPRSRAAPASRRDGPA